MADFGIHHFKLTFLEPHRPLQAAARGVGCTPAGLAMAGTNKLHQIPYSKVFISDVQIRASFAPLAHFKLKFPTFLQPGAMRRIAPRCHFFCVFRPENGA
jgi:hypothetical protein